MPASVISALRRFLPAFQASHPKLAPHTSRALWAINHCRTSMMGGHVFSCPDCGDGAFAYHSCNHRNCPQCGRANTAQWVERELGKRVGAPYFMVTFTLPAELRSLFFGPESKKVYDAFFAAACACLKEKLAVTKWLGASKSGFTAVLHTWDQRLRFHPHLHCIVPGAGVNDKGAVVTVKNANFLVPVNVLARSFRAQFRKQLEALTTQADPVVWSKNWGVHIQPFGNGAAAIKYLGAYVCRTAIGDKRILAINQNSVDIAWRDRADHGKIKPLRLEGGEFVARYLRHVLPCAMRAVRYYGYCHPAAIKTRERVALHTGRTLFIGPAPVTKSNQEPSPQRRCMCCDKAMELRGVIAPGWRSPARPPPVHPVLG